MREPLLGAIEAGGTKFVCGIGTAAGKLIDETRIPTRGPAETIADVVSFFHRRKEDYAALGIASFGPIDLRPESPTYGYITSTPKRGWGNFNFLGALREQFPVPIGFETDTNAAALAEARWGAAQGLRNILYITVGTGIGGGAIIEGSLLHGLVHPRSVGHMRMPHDWVKDPFPGSCPYHGDCLEGMASGPAMEARWGAPASSLPPDHPAFRLEAEYLALACANWVCALSPQKIILGGGVMQPHIFPLLRERTRSLLNGYVDTIEILQHIDSYIIPPGLW